MSSASWSTEIKASTPGVTTAFYRVRCYHNAPIITACRFMKSRTGIKIERVYFSNPQGGKGPCDRKSYFSRTASKQRRVADSTQSEGDSGDEDVRTADDQACFGAPSS